MSKEQTFDVAEVLKLGVRGMTVRLGGCSKAQLGELLAAEQAQGVRARVGVLKAVRAELDAKAAQLSDESVGLIAKAAHGQLVAFNTVSGDAELLTTPWDDLTDDDREEAIAEVVSHLANPARSGETPSETVFFAAIDALVPLFNQIEALSAVVDAAPERAQVGPGSLAEAKPPADGEARGKLVDQVASLAFCEGDDVRFSRAAEPGDFEVDAIKARYVRPTVLRRDKPRVRIDMVAMLDAQGRPIAKVRWPKTLEGGGGREALFPARSIAFDL